jgi:hypothetical protein
MRGRPSSQKRRKERARKDRKHDKAERRSQRRAAREQRLTSANTGEDPDIAGIVPGPQPLGSDAPTEREDES